ncbi:hypothetical protein GUJ93_ZPchr0013g34834 [Zizania palustris]|uniref:Uncharacterized protein n=1 Tax=Zizania palustris TaxID=103762 RepID=A0A8J6C3J6_ZIZPA|nr:hypothetical protein GUJ93_ZPchr0013g34834 [Zizania palustris]
MRRPAGSLRRASSAVALAVFFGVLVLMSLVTDGGHKPAPPAIAGRRMLAAGAAGAAGAQRSTPEDSMADDPFQDSKRRVPNGPDPIHNRGTGKSGRSPGRA